ncbi:MAG TPA: hypothetical protein VF419_05280 [Nitrososphaeraceae archaeon]
MLPIRKKWTAEAKGLYGGCHQVLRPPTLDKLTTTTISSINTYDKASVSLDNFIGIICEVDFRRLDRCNEGS